MVRDGSDVGSVIREEAEGVGNISGGSCRVLPGLFFGFLNSGSSSMATCL